MHRTRLYNTLITLILMVSLLAPAPVLAEDLPPEKATPSGIIARFTTVEESPAPADPRLAEGAIGPVEPGDTANGAARAISRPYKSFIPHVVSNAAALKPPAAPSGLAAAAVSATSIKLTWKDNADSEQGFKLERAKTGTSPYTLAATLAANAASYVDAGLIPGTSYTYRLSAYNSAGSSAVVSVTRATLKSQTKPVVPAAPSGFGATATGTNSIKLTWTDNASNELGFTLERAPAGSGAYSPVAYLADNAASHVDTGLTPNTSYDYRLSAYNEAGSSAVVTVTRATLPIQTKPAAPASCWTSNTSSTSTMFFWTDSSNNEDYFILDLFIPPGDYNFLANVAPNSTYVTIIDLPPGAQINLRVRAHNALGDSTVCQTRTNTPPLTASGFEVLNSTSYPIVYLDIDGVNQFPVNPMGLLPGGTYAMDLDPGLHSYEFRTGFWQSNTSRFDMYTYSGTFDLPATGVSTLEVLDVTLEGILTQFSDTGMGYWEGYYWDNLVCRTAAFKFYDDSSYDFYVSNRLQSHGTYSEVSRSPSTFSLKFNVGNPDDALLLEMYGEFYLKNGPASWKQITYNYKPQGYVNNPFCP